MRFRRPKTTIGRTPYQLRMPFPGDFSPQNVLANFRELARWANELPFDGGDNFVPYFFKFAPTDPEEAWDINLTLKLQEKFDTDLMPTGIWLVQARLRPDTLPVGAVSLYGNLTMAGPNVTGRDYNTLGSREEAIRTVESVNFLDEEVTYKWVAPPIGSFSLSSTNVVVVDRAEDDLIVQGEYIVGEIDDPDVGPTILESPLGSFLECWALRLTDGYNIPTQLENITP